MHLVGGIVEVAEGDGPVGAGFGAGGDVRAVGQVHGILTLGDGGFLSLHEAVMAEGALFHDAAHAGGDVGGEGLSQIAGPLRVVPVEVAGMVRTRGHAVPAADAAGRNLADDAAFFALVGGDDGAHRHAGRFAALHAGAGQVGHFMIGEGLVIGETEHGEPVERTELVAAVHGGSDVVFRLAGHHARAAARTLVDVDDHAPSYFELFDFRRHHDPPMLLRPSRRQGPRPAGRCRVLCKRWSAPGHSSPCPC